MLFPSTNLVWVGMIWSEAKPKPDRIGFDLILLPKYCQVLQLCFGVVVGGGGRYRKAAFIASIFLFTGSVLASQFCDKYSSVGRVYECYY